MAKQLSRGILNFFRGAGFHLSAPGGLDGGAGEEVIAADLYGGDPFFLGELLDPAPRDAEGQGGLFHGEVSGDQLLLRHDAIIPAGAARVNSPSPSRRPVRQCRRQPFVRGPRRPVCLPAGGGFPLAPRSLLPHNQGTMPAGRPTELTPELQAAFLDAVQVSRFIETAAASVGLSAGTIRDWVRKGKKWDGTAGHEFARHAEFSTLLKMALATKEISCLKVIERAGESNWTAMAWLLERSAPERWGNVKAELARIEKRQNEQEKRLESLQGLPPAVQGRVNGHVAGDGNGHA